MRRNYNVLCVTRDFMRNIKNFNCVFLNTTTTPSNPLPLLSSSLSSLPPSPLFLPPPLSHSHSNQDGLTGARKLCESLIDAVQKEFENWNKSQQPLGFGGTAPGYGPRECLLPICLSVSVRRFKKAPRFTVLLVLLLASDSNLLVFLLFTKCCAWG